MKPWLVERWCLAPTADPAFVAHVLEVYRRPYNSAQPVVCLDETSRQLLGETRAPLPVAPSQLAKADPEYVRGGVAQLFLGTEPPRGWRQVTMGERRTRCEFAQCIKDAERIVLVVDQLNIRRIASLYAAFSPAEARRLAAKREIHHCPQQPSPPLSGI